MVDVFFVAFADFPRLYHLRPSGVALSPPFLLLRLSVVALVLFFVVSLFLRWHPQLYSRYRLPTTACPAVNVICLLYDRLGYYHANIPSDAEKKSKKTKTVRLPENYGGARISSVSSLKLLRPFLRSFGSQKFLAWDLVSQTNEVKLLHFVRSF